MLVNFIVQPIIFFKYFFWFAPFGYLCFQFFLNVIASIIAYVHPSSIWCWGSNLQSLDHELSALITRPWLRAATYHLVYKKLTEDIREKIEAHSHLIL